MDDTPPKRSELEIRIRALIIRVLREEGLLPEPNGKYSAFRPPVNPLDPAVFKKGGN